MGTRSDSSDSRPAPDAFTGGGVVPLGDPVDEARRLVHRAAVTDLTLRVMGGVAVCLQARSDKPFPRRTVKDIDFVTPPGSAAATSRLFEKSGYEPDVMFNTLRGGRRLLFYDHANARNVDVFVGEFSMCHAIPIAARLDRDPLTLPLAELLLTKLQIVELTHRDLRDIYTLAFHHELSDDGEAGTETDVIARLCAGDWGLWRTCTGNLDRSLAHLPSQEIDSRDSALITSRLKDLRDRLEAEPKSRKWRLRSRIGDRVRWYEEPEEEEQADQ
jgi:hypothetical protein